jgi:hypothetical protein
MAKGLPSEVAGTAGLVTALPLGLAGGVLAARLTMR